jgi:hypothetical protein
VTRNIYSIFKQCKGLGSYQILRNIRFRFKFGDGKVLCYRNILVQDDKVLAYVHNGRMLYECVSETCFEYSHKRGIDL